MAHAFNLLHLAPIGDVDGHQNHVLTPARSIYTEVFKSILTHEFIIHNFYIQAYVY